MSPYITACKGSAQVPDFQTSTFLKLLSVHGMITSKWSWFYGFKVKFYLSHLSKILVLHTEKKMLLTTIEHSAKYN